VRISENQDNTMFKCEKHNVWFSVFENCIMCEKEKFEKTFTLEEQLYLDNEEGTEIEEGVNRS
jgi:hypothetical protein